MVDCNLPLWILKSSKSGKEGLYSSTKRNFRKAYMPFTTKFTGLLIELKQRNSSTQELIKGLPEWERYEGEEYKTVTARQSIQLGGAGKGEVEADPFAVEPLGETNEEKREE